mmetsp:Transcript_66073/g.146305  ORF Transcript_66073/g.146305 Transcript_66073/m.146305 type:complete len:200 (+) Transcript_66073:1546-2145(+)
MPGPWLSATLRSRRRSGRRARSARPRIANDSTLRMVSADVSQRLRQPQASRRRSCGGRRISQPGPRPTANEPSLHFARPTPRRSAASQMSSAMGAQSTQRPWQRAMQSSTGPGRTYSASASRWRACALSWQPQRGPAPTASTLLRRSSLACRRLRICSTSSMKPLGRWPRRRPQRHRRSWRQRRGGPKSCRPRSVALRR